VDLEVEIRAQDPVEGYREFRCRFACDERFYTEFCFRPKDSVISIDRKFSGQRRAIIRHREAGISHENGRLSFRMILDRYSAEVFVNGGEKVMTVTLETPREAEGISFHVKGKALLNIKKYRLEI
jgi:beta-fructofuranosidase